MNRTRMVSIQERRAMRFGWKALWSKQEIEATQWMTLRVCLIWASMKSGSLGTMFKED